MLGAGLALCLKCRCQFVIEVSKDDRNRLALFSKVKDLVPIVG